MGLSFFESSPLLILAILILDGLMGDPGGRFHPIVLLGNTLRFLERKVFESLCWNRLGGVLLFIALSILSLGFYFLLHQLFSYISPHLATLFMAVLGAWLMATRSLLQHAKMVSPGADGDLEQMKIEVSKIVGRDTSQMDEKGCRRAATESLAESLVDGILSPIFYLCIAGLPGLIVFKVISTMDSMVGYKNERYLHFGWAGARLDDLFNYIPARLSYLSISLLAFFHPKLDGKAALKVGWSDQHHLPGFNSGWPEATLAGAMRRKLVGPIYRSGVLETELWLGLPEDPECGEPEDVTLASSVVIWNTAFWGILAALFLFGMSSL